MMNREQLEKCIEVLSQARRRPGMFFPCTIDGIYGFLGGIHCVYWDALDLPTNKAIPVAEDIAVAVLRDHGWQPRNAQGPVGEMQAKGLSVADIVDELIAIELDMLTQLKEHLYS